MSNDHNFLIIGSGIIGLSIARKLNRADTKARILILEKEPDTAAHASGRNSGVLHAGFYYTANSRKAQFTVAGNQAMKRYCREKNIIINECGKLVVAQNEQEVESLCELERRGRQNGSNVRLIDAAQAQEIEPNIKTHKYALYSPDTASLNPIEVCQNLKNDLMSHGVRFQFNTRYLGCTGNTVQTTAGDFAAKKIINCGGLYADKIAQDFGFGRTYTMIPFKGLYLKYTKNTTDIRVNIYPVPNLRNPFLGVHFTKTADGGIKIGPTATPAFWRENYDLRHNFRFEEMLSIVGYEIRMLLLNSAGFRNLAWEELRKYSRKYFIQLACRMVKEIDPAGFTEFSKPGIRAQLLNKRTLELVQDFIVEGDKQSIHVLNAVSPAFTCAFPFAEYVVNSYLIDR